MLIDDSLILGLIAKYHDELVRLSVAVRARYWAMCSAGYGATFSDFEGEVAYVLIRELRPEVVYEISPDCGYSTIYLYEALRANASGKLYSFEIEPTKRGQPTYDVLPANALGPLDPKQFELVIGDASVTTTEYPEPDVVLIDSCHDAWFAEWYWQHLLPRVRQVAIIQDICFFDRSEPSTEAEWLMHALAVHGRPFLSLGVLERTPDAHSVRSSFAPRRPYETNSILVAGQRTSLGHPHPPQLRDLTTPDDAESAIRTETAMTFPPTRAIAHREFAALSRYYHRAGDTTLSAHYWRCALGRALGEGRGPQGKALAELVVQALVDRRPGRASGALVVAALYHPRAVRRALRLASSAARGKLAHSRRS